VDPNGFNPRSHEGGIDGSTTSETSLTKYAEAASLQAAMSFSQTSAGVKDISTKLDKSHHHQKKIQDPLLPQNTKDDEKKNLQNTKTSNQKKASKKNQQNSITEKKSTKTLQKPKS